MSGNGVLTGTVRTTMVQALAITLRGLTQVRTAWLAAAAGTIPRGLCGLRIAATTRRSTLATTLASGLFSLFINGLVEEAELGLASGGFASVWDEPAQSGYVQP